MRGRVPRKHIVLRSPSGIQCAQALASLFPVHVEPDLLLSVRNGYISLRRSDDNGFPRSGGPKFLGQVHLDRQHGPFDGHLNVFHDGIPFSNVPRVRTGIRKSETMHRTVDCTESTVAHAADIVYQP